MFCLTSKQVVIDADQAFLNDLDVGQKRSLICRQFTSLRRLAKEESLMLIGNGIPTHYISTMLTKNFRCSGAAPSLTMATHHTLCFIRFVSLVSIGVLQRIKIVCHATVEFNSSRSAAREGNVVQRGSTEISTCGGKSGKR